MLHPNAGVARTSGGFSLQHPRGGSAGSKEARKCFGAQAYSACAVMCGKAIEVICAEYGTKSKNLAGGLKELKEKGVIDQRLLSWGEALREQRNMGAHAGGGFVSRQDARDVLDFAIAICEYVFVLAQKYEAFQERQAKKGQRKPIPKFDPGPATDIPF